MVTAELKTIQNKNSIAELIGENTFYIRYLPNTYSKIEDIKESLASYQVLGNEQPLKVLIEFDVFATASKDAREFAQNNKLPAIAEAIVLSSLPQRILFNFYFKFRKQQHPIKLFPDKKAGLNWLNKI